MVVSFSCIKIMMLSKKTVFPILTGGVCREILMRLHKLFGVWQVDSHCPPSITMRVGQLR
jgi:hypothetical protein